MGRLSSVNRADCALLPMGLLYCVARDEGCWLDFASGECPGGYRAIAAIKWTSLGVFSV